VYTAVERANLLLFISSPKPVTVTEVSLSLLQPSLAHLQPASEIKPQPPPSTLFPIHYSLIIASFDAVSPEVLSVLKKSKWVH
jgi:hypothetical protein